MLDFINTFFKKRKEKRSFQEYGFDVKTFEIDNIGTVQYAQWKHPFEQQKSITKSNGNFYKTLAKHFLNLYYISSIYLSKTYSEIKSKN